MKLRNKNTGDAVTFLRIEPLCKDKLKLTYILSSGLENERYYNSIEKFNEDWEDYKPKDPLITNEKIRKAVRAWAEANAINSGNYYNTDIKFNVTEHRLQWIQTAIEFNDITGLDNLEDGETYTIAELCGEDE